MPPTGIPYYDGLLSERELDVLRHLIAEKKLTDVAQFLGLSLSTVSTYRQRILSKTGLKTNKDLKEYAALYGI